MTDAPGAGTPTGGSAPAGVSTPEEVVAFWQAAGSDAWFTKDDAFDATVRARFLPTYEAAAAGRLSQWETSAQSALALVIVLDQFSRNMFRGSARTFAADPLALAVAERAIERGFDLRLPAQERSFFYLPFEHSESMADQERCCTLFRAMGDAELLKWAELHTDIIRRFGRFPHRNAALGRATTIDEQAFLNDGGFTG